MGVKGQPKPVNPWIECLPGEMRCCGTVGKIVESRDEQGRLHLSLPFDWHKEHRAGPDGRRRCKKGKAKR